MRLLIRADAGPRIGIGHWMRCLALAEAWSARGTVSWVSHPVSAALAERLACAGIRHAVIPSADDEQAVVAPAVAEADWTAVDGYHFDSDYLERLRAPRLLVVDDCALLPRYDCDVIVNQNPPAEELTYPQTRARLLLGSRYAMLRSEFRDAPAKRIAARATRILVTLGGSDPANLTQAVVEALPAGVAARVVIGPENPHWSEPRALPSDVEIVRSPPRMSELMAWADLAVSAAGSTTLELAALGVPMIVIAVAGNQEPLARWFAARGAAIDLAGRIGEARNAIDELLDDSRRRDAMSAAGRSAIDGRGAERVVAAMR